MVLRTTIWTLRKFPGGAETPHLWEDLSKAWALWDRGRLNTQVATWAAAEEVGDVALSVEAAAARKLLTWLLWCLRSKCRILQKLNCCPALGEHPWHRTDSKAQSESDRFLWIRPENPIKMLSCGQMDTESFCFLRWEVWTRAVGPRPPRGTFCLLVPRCLRARSLWQRSQYCMSQFRAEPRHHGGRCYFRITGIWSGFFCFGLVCLCVCFLGGRFHRPRCLHKERSSRIPPFLLEHRKQFHEVIVTFPGATVSHLTLTVHSLC